MFENKKILLFGTSNEITKTIVVKLLAQNAQVHVVVQKDDIVFESPGWSDGLTSFHVIDYYKNENIVSFFEKELKHENRFDGFVFGGGIGGVRPLKLSKRDFIQNMFDANVFSFLEVMRHVVKRNFLNDGASIVALSSVSSIKGLKSKTVYSSSKAALEGAVRGIAAELGDRKIRVNAIQKGWVTSDMNLDFIKDNRMLNDDSDFNKQILGAIEPLELANLVLFLLSDEVRTLTGTSILLDGGYSL